MKTPMDNPFNPTRHSTTPFVILVCAIAAIAGILFGFDTGVISGAILFIAQEFHLSALANGFVVSSVLVGAFFGAVVSGRLAYYIGRRNLLIIVALVFLVGTLGSALSTNIPLLVAMRFIVGVAIGTASYVAPLYISEIAPTSMRGGLVSLNQLAVTIGIFLAYFVDTYYSTHPNNWRWMFGMGLIPAFILLIGMMCLPKSPRWLVLRGLTEEARATLLRIRNPITVDLEVEQIQATIKSKATWRLLFQRWVLPVLIVGFGLAFLQQFCGINTIIYYAPTIFKFAGFASNKSAILATTIIGAVNVLTTIVAIFLVDRFGRKPLLYFGFIVMGLSLAFLSLGFYLDAHEGVLRWFTLGSLIAFIIGFAVSIGPIMWLMFSEIFPLEIRGLGSSFAAASNWLANALVTFSFLKLLDVMGKSGIFLLYAAVCVLGFIFVYAWVPETKNISLEQIEMNLRAGLRSRELGKLPK